MQIHRGEKVSYLRSNYMRETTKRVLKNKGFRISEQIRNLPGSSTIDLIGSDIRENRHLIFDFKSGPVSTLDVARFHASIKDVRLSGRKSAFLVTDSSFTSSAKALSTKLRIQMVKTDKKTVRQTMDRIVK